MEQENPAPVFVEFQLAEKIIWTLGTGAGTIRTWRVQGGGDLTEVSPGFAARTLAGQRPEDHARGTVYAEVLPAGSTLCTVDVDDTVRAWRVKPDGSFGSLSIVDDTARREDDT